MGVQETQSLSHTQTHWVATNQLPILIRDGPDSSGCVRTVDDASVQQDLLCSPLSICQQIRPVSVAPSHVHRELEWSVCDPKQSSLPKPAAREEVTRAGFLKRRKNLEARKPKTLLHYVPTITAKTFRAIPKENFCSFPTCSHSQSLVWRQMWKVIFTKLKCHPRPPGDELPFLSKKKQTKTMFCITACSVHIGEHVLRQKFSFIQCFLCLRLFQTAKLNSRTR